MQFIYSKFKKIKPERETKHHAQQYVFTFKLQVIFLLKLVAVNTFYILSYIYDNNEPLHNFLLWKAALRREFFA